MKLLKSKISDHDWVKPADNEQETALKDNPIHRRVRPFFFILISPLTIRLLKSCGLFDTCF
jgi:hypothetical protein